MQNRCRNLMSCRLLTNIPTCLYLRSWHRGKPSTIIHFYIYIYKKRVADNEQVVHLHIRKSPLRLKCFPLTILTVFTSLFIPGLCVWHPKQRLPPQTSKIHRDGAECEFQSCNARGKKFIFCLASLVWLAVKTQTLNNYMLLVAVRDWGLCNSPNMLDITDNSTRLFIYVQH